MRKQIVTVVAAGALGLTGLAVAGPAALAAVGAEDSATALTSRVDRIKQALSGLVTDGTITQQQADQVATTLGSADLGRGGHGGREGFGPGLSTAATALGITKAELRTALEADGATLASVAKARGVAVDKLIGALVDAGKARIAQAVTDGELTQAQADEKLADLQARVTERVNSTRPVRGDHGRRTAPKATPDSPAPAPAPSASTSSYAG